MSLYKVGCAQPVGLIYVGAEEPKKEGGLAPILIVLGLMGFVFVAIPGKKGWQRALGSGQ